MQIKDILDELNLENGGNYKLSVLKKYKDNELFKRVLKMTYDKVQFTYGISMKNIAYTPESGRSISLENALGVLESKFCTREYTGNEAIEELQKLLSNLSEGNAYVLERIIDRDLKANTSTSSINKVWKDLITKPPYMRCGVYNEKTAKKISFPACVQLKADGRFSYIIKEDDIITFMSRSGEESNFPVFAETFKNLKNGVYAGELLVRGLTDRSEANGLINSDNPPEDRMYTQLWDYLTLEEWNAKSSKNPYLERFKELSSIVNKHLLIPTYNANNLQDALKATSDWMSAGYEGSILKDWSTPFKDGTSATQLKLKLEIDCEVRITGFTEGTKGTKREKTFGAITYENDEGTIKGQCSGFSDKQLEDFNSRREELIGRVITVQFNDLSKARGNDYYALSHPRFIELREKDETDTLERVFELREMAMQLGKK